MKRLIALSSLALLLGACSSTDGERDARPARRGQSGGRRAQTDRAPATGMLDMLPPPGWWHDPQIAGAVELSADQYTSLDRLGRSEGDEIARIERDAAAATGELRRLLDSDDPRRDDIIAAGQRLRVLRDDVYDRQLRMLAGERHILSKRQWDALQMQLRERGSWRDRDRDDPYGGYGRRGNRGPGRRGPRGPGWPGPV